jgi:hypothetical protein
MQVGAVFGIIFAIIVMALLLAFGSGQIINIICLGNLAQTNKAIRDLEFLVDGIQASGPESSDTFGVSIPGNARLCFVDPEHPEPNFLGRWNPDPDSFIELDIKEKGYNLWIEYGCGSSDKGYRMDYVVVRGPSDTTNRNFCIGSGETLLLTNIGVEVRVEPFTG